MNPKEEIETGPHRFCEKVKFGSHRFHGVTDATLPHDEGWEFLRIGWSLERAEMTARLVDVQYHNLLDAHSTLEAPDNHQWMAVLKSVGAYETYHRQYHSPIEAERVAEMLILHPQHPRSIRFSIPKCSPACVRSATPPPAPTPTKPNASPENSSKVCATTPSTRFSGAGLHSYLSDLLRVCGSIGADIARTYFYYSVVA